MLRITGISKLSLRIKLVLSYLVVALGATVIVSLATALAIQNYLTYLQSEDLKGRATYQARFLEYQFASLERTGENWENAINARMDNGDPTLLVITNKRGEQILCRQPGSPSQQDSCNDPELKQAITRTLQDQEVSGSISVSTFKGTFSSLYVSVPLHLNNEVTGALILSEPQTSLIATLLLRINLTILIVSITVTLIVVLFSFLIARHLTRPLEKLTAVTEQMKHGKYTQRVEPPQSQDEMGKLALAFNEMADRIESDVNELRHQEQVRRDLIANIAHDLATPLTAIQGFSEALADDMLPTTEARHETAQRIAREVQRLRRLVGEMQQMSSLESGRAQLDLAPLDIHSLVDETLAVIEPETEQRHITLRNEIDTSIQPVLADSDRITQVLLNLLDNARRHTPEYGTISIGAAVEDRNLRIWIKDTGEGIDSSDLPHIFERFYRADRSRTRSTGGSGLGLAIVKAIITAHNGRIWAESTRGQGTRISFTLPLAVQSIPAVVRI